jgi:calcineurin-like phosphoesterase family protein
MKIHYFLGDPHWGHGNILRFCDRILWMTDREKELQIKEKALLSQGKDPRKDKELLTLDNGTPFKVSYDTIQRMNDDLIKNINNLVGVNDVLWILGDFAMHNENVTREYRNKINCNNVHLIRGNHDVERPEKYFNIVRDLVSVSITPDGSYYLDSRMRGCREVVLCHYAMAFWNKSHQGVYHFYGHSHGGAEDMLNEKFPDRKSLDVGVDNAYKLLGEYRPFALEEAIGIIDKRIQTYTKSK